MDKNTILFVDSGVGGLTILRETRVWLPQFRFIYVADDGAFPYGNWEAKALEDHLMGLFDYLLKYWQCKYIVIACHTASTLILEKLRETYPDRTFVGIVPAIKVAAERTHSGLVSVLATPATIERAYTHWLIDEFAHNVEVNLVGARELAQMAESYLRGQPINISLLTEQLQPLFVEKNGERTDIVVLACTHYPFLIGLFRRYAPWPVDWIDPAEAISRQLSRLIEDKPALSEARLWHDIFYLTSEKPDIMTERLFQGFGFKYQRRLS